MWRESCSSADEATVNGPDRQITLIFVLLALVAVFTLAHCGR